MRIRLVFLPHCAVATMLGLLAMAAHADIYRSVDADGLITFSNLPAPGAAKVYSDPIPMGKVRPRNGGGTSGTHTTPSSPADFPHVDAATQKSRDTNRKQILQDELSTEQQALADSRRSLTEAQSSPDAKASPAKYQERVNRLRDNATLHEKNVAALQQELTRNK